MKPDINIIFCLFLLLALSSCGCKDTIQPVTEENKKWVPYQHGDRINYLLNNKDTVEYIAEVAITNDNISFGSYGSGKNCTDKIERLNVNIKKTSANSTFEPGSIEKLLYNIIPGNSNNSCSFYKFSIEASSEPDSNVVINGITYPVYNFNYDTKYHYLQKVTFSKDLGYLYVRDTAGNFITYLNKIH